MDESRDPRIQIYANLDDVQKEIEQAAKERKDEIRSEAKEYQKSVRAEMKDLIKETKDCFRQYQDYKKSTDDPIASEKISTAKEASKVVEKGIKNDYEETKDRIDREAEHRINSIDNMFGDSQK